MVHAGTVDHRSPTPTDLAGLATEVAREAAEMARTALREARHLVETKSTATDMVTATDRAIEAHILERLLNARPDDGFLGEESSERSGTSGIRWIVDPIDGTTNFFYGLPGFNTSIAAERDGEIIAGVVVDPVRDELFSATLGGGATCNGVPIRCTDATTAALALVVTGFSYRIDRRRAQARVVADLIGEVRDIRRLGAAALDLCMVAAGRVDAYFESGLQPWDRAAGVLIAREAGARVEDLHGGDPSSTFVLASSPGVFDELAATLRRLDAEEPPAPVPRTS